MNVVVPECVDICMENEALDRVVEVVEMLCDVSPSSDCTLVTHEELAKVGFSLVHPNLINEFSLGTRALNDANL